MKKDTLIILFLLVFALSCTITKLTGEADKFISIKFETYNADSVVLQYLKGNNWVDDTTFHQPSIGWTAVWRKADIYRIVAFINDKKDFSNANSIK